MIIGTNEIEKKKFTVTQLLLAGRLEENNNKIILFSFIQNVETPFAGHDEDGSRPTDQGRDHYNVITTLRSTERYISERRRR